jgi:hypothetical protein
MQRLLLNVAAVIAFALLLAPAAFASGEVQRRATLDFDFVFGGQQLPAGTYVIKRLGGSATADRFLVIEDAAGRRRAVTLATPVRPIGVAEANDLTFRKSGGVYHLTGVELGGLKYAVSPPKARSQATVARASTRP